MHVSVPRLEESNRFRLDETFLTDYRGRQPQWGPLGYVTYLRTYSRPIYDDAGHLVRNEEFVDTLERVTNGTFSYLKQQVRSSGQHWDEAEAQVKAAEFFTRMWQFKWLPPGRGLWMMGTGYVEQHGSAALQNCGFVATNRISYDFSGPFCEIMDYSMLGVGMGFDVSGSGLVRVQEPERSGQFVVADTREGWVEVVRTTLDAYVGLNPLPTFDYSRVRPEGSPIRGFGGTASGPGPLKELVAFICATLDGLIGQLLDETAITDIANCIGRCVVAGNVRRSSEIAISDHTDVAFRKLKDPTELYALLAEQHEIQQSIPEWLDLEARKQPLIASQQGLSVLDATYLAVQLDIDAIEAEQKEMLRVNLDWRRVEKRIQETPLRHHRWASNNSINCDVIDGRYPDYQEIGQQIATNGEPGVIWLNVMRTRGRVVDAPIGTDHRVAGCNPCLTADTRIATQYGLVPIGELARKGHKLRVTTDGRVEADYQVGRDVGTSVLAATSAFKTSDAEPVWAVTTRSGYTVRATAYHKFPTPDGFVELKDLSAGDTLLLQSDEGPWGSAGSEDIGTIIGSLEGDGNFNGDTDKVTLRFWGDQKVLAGHFLPMCQRVAATIPAVNGRSYTLSVVDVESRDSCEIASERLGKALEEVGYTEKGRVPEVVWRGSRECVRGYLRGLFAADGTINWTRNNQTFSIRYSQSNRELLRDVQDLLLNFGIVSSLYKRKDAGVSVLPNGKGGSQAYPTKDFFEIVISKQNAVRFNEKIGFIDAAKEAKYASWEAAWRKGPYAESFTDEIVSIEPAGTEPVFCLTQDATHSFIAAGIVTGNCSEQQLEDGELCCLVETFPTHHDGLDDYLVTLKYAFLYAKVVTCIPTHNARTNAVIARNRRIGTSQAGVAAMYEKLGLRECTRWWDVAYAEIQRLDESYSGWMGAPRSIRTTSIKPGGTVPLLAGVEGGMKFVFSRHQFRTIRIDHLSPLVERLRAAGYRVEPDRTTPRSMVCYFPIEQDVGRYARDITMWEQVALLAALQAHWSDNMVSATITFQPHEAADIGRVMEVYEGRLKSISFLPLSDHGYVQAPYIPCTQAEYESAVARIVPVDFSDLNRASTHESAAEERFCSGGICEIPVANNAE